MLTTFIVYSVLVLTLLGQIGKLYDFVVEVVQSFQDFTH